MGFAALVMAVAIRVSLDAYTGCAVCLLTSTTTLTAMEIFRKCPHRATLPILFSGR